MLLLFQFVGFFISDFCADALRQWQTLLINHFIAITVSLSYNFFNKQQRYGRARIIVVMFHILIWRADIVVMYHIFIRTGDMISILT